MVFPPPIPTRTSTCFCRMMVDNRDNSSSQHSPRNNSVGMACALQSIPHWGSTFWLTEGEARISPCLPSKSINAGNSLMAPTPWIYFPGKTAFLNIWTSRFLHDYRNRWSVLFTTCEVTLQLQLYYASFEKVNELTPFSTSKDLLYCFSNSFFIAFFAVLWI